MGGKRRKRKVVIKKKVYTPKVFRCPICEGFPIRLDISKEGEVVAKCGYCGFSRTFSVNPGSEPVDAYSKLISILSEQEGVGSST